MVKKRGKLNSEKVYSVFSYAFLISMALISFFPIVYAFGLSLVSYDEWHARGATGYFLFPSRPVLDAYQKVFSSGSIIFNSFLVSSLRVILGVSLTLTVSMVAGYVVSRRRLPGRRFLVTLLIFTVIFSGGLIPNYLITYSTGLLDTIWSLIIPSLVLPGLVDTFGALVFKQFFEGIPSEVEESAVMDGAGEFKIMMRISLPMSTGVIAALGMFIAVNHWNAYFDALLFIQTSTKMPLQLILRQIFQNAMSLDTMSSMLALMGKKYPLQALQMATTMVGVLPILFIYPFVQKYFTQGVYMGAVKG